MWEDDEEGFEEDAEDFLALADDEDDGSILQDGLYSPYVVDGFVGGDFSLPFAGMIVGVVYPDEEISLGSRGAEYNVLDEDRELIFNVQCTMGAGGFKNGLDRVLTPATKTILGKPIDFDNTPFEEMNGTYVLMVCVYGNINHIHIVDVLPHPRTTLNPTKKGGERVLFSHQDTLLSLDKEGTLDIKRAKTRDPNGIITAYEDTAIQLSKDNTITIKTTNCEIKVENGKLTVTSPDVDIFSDQVTIKSSSASVSQPLCNAYFQSQVVLLANQVGILSGALAGAAAIPSLWFLVGPTIAGPLGLITTAVGNLALQLGSSALSVTQNLDSQ
jgi:hypothetical protein